VCVYNHFGVRRLFSVFESGNNNLFISFGPVLPNTDEHSMLPRTFPTDLFVNWN